MDPNLFHLDWERTLEAFVTFLIMSVVIERVASLILESRVFLMLVRTPGPDSAQGAREAAELQLAERLLALDDDELPVARASDTPADSLLWLPPGTSITDTKGLATEFLRRYARRARRRRLLQFVPAEELITFGIALPAAVSFNFDIFAIVLLAESTTLWGIALTSAALAGSRGFSSKAFRDLLGVQSRAHEEFRGRYGGAGP